MNERRQQHIQEYLQQSEAQARILGHIQQARSNLAVTISKAAHLFNFSESQLREWEKRGLLRTERPLLSTDGKGLTGHRQYPLNELFKLAVIRDLINQGYSPGDIPVDVDKLWENVAGSLPGALPDQPGVQAPSLEERVYTRQLSINARVEQADAHAFWRYFVAQALRLSLLLICEDVPDTVAGFVLPLEDRSLAGFLTDPIDLRNVGRSLVGWLDRNRSFHMFLTDAVSFDFPTDYRLQTLKLAGEQVLAGERVLDNTFVVLERKAGQIAFSRELQQCIQRLL